MNLTTMEQFKGRLYDEAFPDIVARVAAAEMRLVAWEVGTPEEPQSDPDRFTVWMVDGVIIRFVLG